MVGPLQSRKTREAGSRVTGMTHQSTSPRNTRETCLVGSKHSAGRITISQAKAANQSTSVPKTGHLEPANQHVGKDGQRFGRFQPWLAAPTDSYACRRGE